MSKTGNPSVAHAIELRHKITALILSFLTSIACIEIGFRLFPELIPETIRSYFPYYGLYLFDRSIPGLALDEDLGFRYEPFSKSQCRYIGDLVYQYNLSSLTDSDYTLVSLSYDADGFRNPCAGDSDRVIMIGDSMIEAIGVADDDLFYCQKNTRPWRIRTLATSTYCSAQYLTLMKRHAFRNSPELIIVSIFESNDIDDRETYESWKLSGLTYTQFLRTIIPAKNRSILFNLVRYGKGVLELKFNRPREGRSVFAYPEVRLAENRTGYIGNDYFRRIVRTKSEWKANPGYPLLLKDLSEMSQRCREAGVSFAVMLMPDKAHIYIDSILDSHPEETLRTALRRPSQHSEPSDRAFHENLTASVDSLRELLQEWCVSHDTAFIDPIPAFQDSAAHGEILYGKFDTHLNARGHACLAELLTERIPRILDAAHSSQSNSTESH